MVLISYPGKAFIRKQIRLHLVSHSLISLLVYIIIAYIQLYLLHNIFIIISPKIISFLVHTRCFCAKLKSDMAILVSLVDTYSIYNYLGGYWIKIFLNSGLSHSDLDTVLSQQARASESAKDKDWSCVLRSTSRPMLRPVP